MDFVLIEKIVDWMIKEGTAKTTEGNWVFYADELYEKFRVSETWLETFNEEIENALYEHEEVADVIALNNSFALNNPFEELGFDICFYTSFCPNVEDEDDEPDTSDMVDQYYFAESRWTVEDAIDAAKENGIELTPKQAEEWWKKNEKYFRESLIAIGSQMLADADFSEI